MYSFAMINMKLLVFTFKHIRARVVAYLLTSPELIILMKILFLVCPI